MRPTSSFSLTRLAVPLLLLLALLLTRSGPVESQPKPIRIGEINSYGGFLSVWTDPYKEGILMAVKEINDAGGVRGRPLQFVFRTDKLRPDEAVKAARELVLSEKVDFLAGCIVDASCLAISAFAKEQKVLFFATFGQSSRLTWEDGHRYVARTTMNTSQYARIIAKRVSTLPSKKWALIAADDEYGHNLWGEFWSYLKHLKPGVEMVQENWIRPGETEYSPYITGLLRSGADSLFSTIGGTMEIAFLKQSKPFGLLDKMRYVSPQVGSPDELDALGPEAPIGALTSGLAWYDPGIQRRYPRFVEWHRRYATWTKGKTPTLGAVWGWMSVEIIAEAIRRAGTTDTEEVIGILSKGFEMDLLGYTATMRGCDQQGLNEVWTGVVTTNNQGHPIMGDVQVVHGKEVIKSCEEVLRLRADAQKARK